MINFIFIVHINILQFLSVCLNTHKVKNLDLWIVIAFSFMQFDIRDYFRKTTVVTHSHH